MSKLLSDKTVASFGDGPEIYKREIEKLGHVKLYDFVPNVNVNITFDPR
jgi:hypothetical protein